MNFQTLKLERFTKEHIPELLEFCYDAYLAGSNLYPNTPQARQQFNQLSTQAILLFIEASQIVNNRRGTKTMFNYFVRKDGTMIAALFHCQLHYFFKEIVPNHNFQDNLYRPVPLKIALQVKEYTAVFGFRASIRPEYQQTGLFNYIASERKKLFMKEGYEYGYAMANNLKVIGFITKNKGEIIYSYIGSYLSSTVQRHILRTKYINVPDYNPKGASL